MIRLAAWLGLFLGLAVASVALADPSSSPASNPPRAGAESLPGREHWAGTEPAPRKPRWVPTQARKREELGPAVLPHPLLLVPPAIANLPF